MTTSWQGKGATARQGYTLMELIVVIGLIVFLAVLSIPALAPLMRKKALREAAFQMKAALLQARMDAIAREEDRVPLIPIQLRGQPPRWAIPTRMTEWFDFESEDPSSNQTYPKYWDGSTSTWTVDYVDDTQSPTDTITAPGGVHGNYCWTHRKANPTGEYVYGFMQSDDGNPNDNTDYRLHVYRTNVLGVWAYLDDNVKGVGFSVRLDDSNGNDRGWTATVYWGEGISHEGYTVRKGELPPKNKWVHLAASVDELGARDGWYITGMKFRQYTDDPGGCNVWWDRVVLWKKVFVLPDFIEPDMASFPIEFDSDGRLKAVQVNRTLEASPIKNRRAATYWFDRLIILKDTRNRELAQYLRMYDVNADGFWECEPFSDTNDDGWRGSGEAFLDYGLDRAKGTGDTGEGNSQWDYEGQSVTPEDRPTRSPSGQIYIKVNKVTGMARVCETPGG